MSAPRFAAAVGTALSLFRGAVMLAGFVSAALLAFDGEWRALGIGLVLLFTGVWIMGFAMGPTLLFLLPGQKLLDSGRTGAAHALLALGSIASNAIVGLWCLAVLYAIALRGHAHPSVPLLLWSCGVATSVLAGLVNEERKAGGTAEGGVVGHLFATLGYLAAVVGIRWFGWTLAGAAVALGIALAVSTFLQWALALSLMREQARRDEALDLVSPLFDSTDSEPRPRGLFQDAKLKRPSS